jgi:steroid delta-isomerase-like uncharacterized protein
MTEYQRIWVEGLNRGDATVAKDVFTSDAVVHINGSPDPNLSVDGFTQMVSGLLGAFPDFRVTVEDQIVTADRVATRWTAEGTNRGAFGPVPATGRRVRISGLIFDKVAAGKVVERWEQWDQMGMMQQLGLV